MNFNGTYIYFTLEIKSVLAKPYFSTYLVGESVLDGRQIDNDTFLRGRFVVRKTGGQRCHHYKSFQALKWSETLRLVLLFKGQTISKANYGLLNSPKKRTKCTHSLTIVSLFWFEENKKVDIAWNSSC